MPRAVMLMVIRGEKLGEKLNDIGGFIGGPGRGFPGEASHWGKVCIGIASRSKASGRGRLIGID